MPRSLQYILDHAEEMAREAENFEPDDDGPAYGYNLAALIRAVLEVGDAERHLAEAVEAARATGAPWSAIGMIMGISGQAARQRYGGKATVKTHTS